jgi:hypothetical protein
MVTGKRAFEGKSQASLIAGILEKQPPPMTELQPMTPPGLSRVVRTCLEKDPDDRFQTAHDLALHIEWIEEGGSIAGLPAPVIASRKRRERMWFAGIALIVAAAAAAATWIAKPAPPTVPGVVERFVDALAEDQTFSRTGRRVVALSADGAKLAYVANNQIYLRKLNERESVVAGVFAQRRMDCVLDEPVRREQRRQRLPVARSGQRRHPDPALQGRESVRNQLGR